MDQKMIDRAVEAAAKAMYVRGETEGLMWGALDLDMDTYRALAGEAVTAALAEVEASLTAERDRLRAGWCEHNKCPGNSVCCCQTNEVARMAEEVRQQRAAIARIEALLPDEDDPYVHVHPLPGGEPDCGGCWDADIRKALRVGGE